MSLTSFIKIPAVKAIFREEFPLKQTLLEGEMKAIPVTKNYPLVGTAFDYLFRFFLEQKNPNCITKTWVAEHSLSLLEKSIAESEKNAVPKNVIKASERMKLHLKDAKETFDNYMNTGKINDDLIRSSIILAQMDALYRSGNIPPDLGKVNDGDVHDLRNLISLVNPETYQAYSAY